MSNKERPDTFVPQAARLGKRKRGSALIQAMNERDEVLKAESTPSEQHSAKTRERNVPQSGKEVQDQRSIPSEQHSAKPQESSIPQSGKEVQDYQAAESNPPLFDEEETKHTDTQYSKKIDNHEESVLTKDSEEKLEKVTFYITLLQLEKLEDMVYEYKKRTRVRRANRNDIIRILIDQSSITDLFK